MRVIRLFCAGGMSTSLLVNKMKDYAKTIGYDCDIVAYGVADFVNEAPAADCILLGPQVGYKKAEFAAKFPEKPLAVIDMRQYGMMDGKAVLETAKKMLGD